MLVYLFIDALLLYGSYCNRSKNIGILIFFFLFILCLFRGINVGIDTPAYFLNDMTYGSDGKMLSSYDYELTTLWFRNFIIEHNLSPRWLLYGLAIITYFFFYKASKSFNVNLVLFCLFFYLYEYFFLSMNIARQMAASGIILYAYSVLNSNKHYLFFLLILFAASIHFSSIVFIIFYVVRFLPDIKIKDKGISIYLLFTIFFLVAPYLSGWAFGKAMSVFQVLEMYGRFGDELEVNSKSLIVFVIEYINLMVCVRVLIWLKADSQNRILSYLFLISLVLGVIIGSLFGISRILIGIKVIQLVGFALYFEDMRSGGNNKRVIFSLYVFMNMYLVSSAIFQGNYEVCPYSMTLPF